MKKILTDWFTGPGSTHFEMGRFLLFVGFFVGLFLQGYSIYFGGVFDVVDFFQAVGAYILLGGAGIAAKDYSSGNSVKHG